ncbi:hypothetical protein HELRODRAFT_182602 [Helobdella robusta]|uniref:Uncharacterized protein n=1 Tax=Helobdella robusta TaxID=6412 RepID=T1FIG3_HELRO|nr:hypothetical protein HELRODRAFT_182602 [Helobdella robusta]ESN90774.1 hypothetical protein HELRODRAFT_182602 [Helobdella robusta]
MSHDVLAQTIDKYKAAMNMIVSSDTAYMSNSNNQIQSTRENKHQMYRSNGNERVSPRQTCFSCGKTCHIAKRSTWKSRDTFTATRNVIRFETNKETKRPQQKHQRQPKKQPQQHQEQTNDEITNYKKNDNISSSRYDHKPSDGTLPPRSSNAENFPESLKTPAKPTTSKQVSVGFPSTHASLASSTDNERTHTVSGSLSVACVTLEHPSHNLLKDNNFIWNKNSSNLPLKMPINLFRFYSYCLKKRFRPDLFEHFQEETISDYQSGQLYGLEKFWAFLKYSRKHVLVDGRLRGWLSKYRRLEDFRVEPPLKSDRTPKDQIHQKIEVVANITKNIRCEAVPISDYTMPEFFTKPARPDPDANFGTPKSFVAPSTSDESRKALLNADARIIVDFLMLVFVLSSTAATLGDIMSLRCLCCVAEFVLLEHADCTRNSSSDLSSSLESWQTDDAVECVALSSCWSAADSAVGDNPLRPRNNYNNVITNNFDDVNNNHTNGDNLNNNINNTNNNINNNINNNNNNSANTVDTNATTYSANISCNWNLINGDNPNNNINNINNNNNSINNNNNNSANTVDTNATTHSANITCKWNIITRSKKNHSDDNNNNNVNNNNNNNVFKYCQNNIKNM